MIIDIVLIFHDCKKILKYYLIRKRIIIDRIPVYDPVHVLSPERKIRSCDGVMRCTD